MRIMNCAFELDDKEEKLSRKRRKREVIGGKKVGEGRYWKDEGIFFFKKKLKSQHCQKAEEVE